MIKEFKNIDLFNDFIFNKTMNYDIGYGGEGECFLGNDLLVYKVIHDGLRNTYNIDNIITTSDYDLKHFSFPIDVYTDFDHKLLYGYTAKYFEDDLFDMLFSYSIDYNLENLLSSYYKVLEEIKILSNDKIFLYDIINNVLFDNKELMVIDTIGYEKRDYDTYKENAKLLLNSIENVFYFISDHNSVFQDEESIEQIIDNVKKYVKLRKY